MALSNPDAIVTEQDLANFYQGILPYLGSGSVKSIVYGIRILRDESVPSAKVVYLKDAVGMTPAHMNYTNNVFDYGSWRNAFFMPKPCMLKYDGTVDYYLDPDDYTKKSDGITASDVANASYAGNAMMEWPKIWLKIVPDSGKNNRQADIYISNKQTDEYYTDWPYHNANGDSVEHFYTPIYNGSLIDSKLRSISGQTAMKSKTAQQELDYALSNNPSGEHLWTTEVIADIDLINILLMLISKTTDSQTAFGMGLCNDGTEAINDGFRTGVHNAKGLFYGTNSGAAATYTNAVKVFGMENWWGFQCRRHIGEVMVSGTYKRKLTYGQEDGSTTTGYNFTGSGYVDCEVSNPSGTNGEYVSSIIYTAQGIFPIAVGGTSSTYYCDGFWYEKTGTVVNSFGGNSAHGSKAGIFDRLFNDGPSRTGWFINASLSCKPNAPS